MSHCENCKKKVSQSTLRCLDSTDPALLCAACERRQGAA